MKASQILLSLSLGVSAIAGRSAKPNFIFIITDDQDLHLDSLEYQASVQKHFAQEGTWFKKHFCTIALCCPSRVSLLTGKAAHNTNVTDVSAPYEEAIAASDRPFFLGVAPIAPHSETITQPRPPKFLPPVPAKRHEHLFPDAKVPRTPNFNPNITGTTSYFKTLRKLNQSEIDYNDAWYRRRVQSLQSVDELIDSIISRLEASPEVFENTYLIYTTDNGFHIGQHRLPPGKSCGIEEDVNIPFFIRGPGVAKGAVQTVPSSHTDIVPTLFHLAGIPLREDFDGEPIPVTTDMQARNEKSEHVNIEFWGKYLVEGNTFYGQDSFANNTYKTVRVVGDEYDLSYTVWCTNEHEVYDMTSDAYQLTNLYGHDTTTNNGWSIRKLTARLDALLLTLKRCKGRVCTRPWEALHPNGEVSNLRDAMDERYDAFYIEHQPPVTFEECTLGQILSKEGALEPLSWQNEWDAWSWEV
ncbi:arylsulfatase precursor [Stemphylium lycopersici]|uniref:Arylsulfatase n=1 Tax=Stemphylium lycopersici TaxID=183478 RepID=A0A364N4H7_STELY|nr:arylsulfatase precursor [Stemphylium lycopersici]RAR11398.1 arylsulfatase precursor [Stemphylium lycopersici]